MKYFASIIIPTLNEEKALPKLLDSIERQQVGEKEVIVADAGSQDATRQIAERYGCKVAEGGLPAYGRNAGARAASGTVLLFLDADVELPDEFLKNSLEEFENRKLDVASYRLYPETRWTRFLFAAFYNIPILLLERIVPHGAMGIMVRKNVFESAGGFDESLRMLEDMHFMKKAAQYGTFGIFRSAALRISTRRYRREGWIRTALIYYLAYFHTQIIGPVRSDIFRFRLPQTHPKD